MEAADVEGRRGSETQGLLTRRQLPKRATDLGPPLFKLAGLAIGNGLTDPATQASPGPFVLTNRWGGRSWVPPVGNRMMRCFIYCVPSYELMDH